jgi:hypothetical protein
LTNVNAAELPFSISVWMDDSSIVPPKLNAMSSKM